MNQIIIFIHTKIHRTHTLVRHISDQRSRKRTVEYVLSPISLFSVIPAGVFLSEQSWFSGFLHPHTAQINKGSLKTLFRNKDTYFR